MAEKEYHLPFDYARCSGYNHADCDDCLRRLAPGNPYRQSYMSPPIPSKDVNEVGVCTYKIGVDK